MSENRLKIFPLAPLHIAGLAALQITLTLIFFDASLALLPVGAFLGFAFLVAPFFPSLRFFMPAVTRGKRSGKATALTFDDGPDPETTPRLLELLKAEGVKATFFVVGKKAEARPELIEKIIKEGHEIGNHTYSHDVFLALKGEQKIAEEIYKCQEILQKQGVTPIAFRPPVNIVSPKFWPPLLERGMYYVSASIKACDFGNRRIASISSKILRKIKSGDIVLLHDVKPNEGFKVDKWLFEIKVLIEGVRQKGFEIQPLSTLIGREVTTFAKDARPRDAVTLFYDSLAREYDEEQERETFVARRVEKEIVKAKLEKFLHPEFRVLEIGAGTGRFTLDIARRCREVVAVDISTRMLEVLKRKAEKEKITNIRLISGDASEIDLEGSFDLICSFSALEYAPDLGAFFSRLLPRLNVGGRIYFTTANRSLFRFFAQLGNAMRQGVWLKSRSPKEVCALFTELGLRTEKVSSHCLKITSQGGMLLEASAIRPALAVGENKAVEN